MQINEPGSHEQAAGSGQLVEETWLPSHERIPPAVVSWALSCLLLGKFPFCNEVPHVECEMGREREKLFCPK